MPKGKGGPQPAYKHGGFAAVWRWAKARGLKGWLKARNWAKRRAHQAKDPDGFRKARDAYDRKVDWLRSHKDPKPSGDHESIVMFDGKQVAHWIAKVCHDARESGVWKGSVYSGYRSPEYSTQLCINMCGAPTCPGRCAGASSNHSCPPSHTCGYPEGAVDVTDPEGLVAYARAHNRGLRGAGDVLPYDVPHCSHTGR